MKNHDSTLGALIDPKQFTSPLNVSSHSSNRLRAMLDAMLGIRIVEEAIAGLVESGEARCPCHLAIGQEAAAVGVAQALRPSDRAFGGHRSHSHFLAMGGAVQELLNEVLGKAAGCSRGMGGSMHLYGPDFGFMGSVPIVGGTIPIAVGAGLAAKMDCSGDVAVAFFGDGASEEGVLHESLNLASQYEIPVLFVCENNLYSSHLDIAQRQPTDSIARFASAHSIDSKVVDGNDVLAVADTARGLVDRMRGGSGPAFLEAVTYRWRGHVGADENIDVGVRRRAEDIVAWKRRDPVERLLAGMNAAGDNLNFDEVESPIRALVEDALEAARNAPYPSDQQNYTSVYRVLA